MAKIRPLTPGFLNWGPPDFHNSDEISIILPYLGILARHISGMFPAHTLENHISGNGVDLEKEKVFGNNLL